MGVSVGKVASGSSYHQVELGGECPGDRKVRLKNIKPGHLVLRRVANLDTVGKLQLKWEGPFLVVSSSRPGSYRLKDMDGNDIPRSWNVDELRRYYV